MKYHIVLASLLLTSLAINQTYGEEDNEDEEIKKYLKPRFKIAASSDGDDQSLSVKDSLKMDGGLGLGQGLTKEQAEKCIKQFDEDKNGTVSFEEYFTLYKTASEATEKAREGDVAALDSEVIKNCIRLDHQKKMKKRYGGRKI